MGDDDVTQLHEANGRGEPDPLVGAVVGGTYRVEALLGRGGATAVYRATHVELGREVVLTTLRADLRNDERLAERFAREAKAVARLRHPNIATIHDYGESEGGLAYLAGLDAEELVGCPGEDGGDVGVDDGDGGGRASIECEPVFGRGFHDHFQGGVELASHGDLS